MHARNAPWPALQELTCRRREVKPSVFRALISADSEVIEVVRLVEVWPAFLGLLVVEKEELGLRVLQAECLLLEVAQLAAHVIGAARNEEVLRTGRHESEAVRHGPALSGSGTP